MIFPDTVEEFMEQYEIIDTKQVYTNGIEFVPIFRMKQWFEHLPSTQPEKMSDLTGWRKVGNDLFPADGQECLVTVQITKDISRVELATYSTDLYTVDDYDFEDCKGKPGWYHCDGDFGYVETRNVVAWMPAPEPYREEGDPE